MKKIFLALSVAACAAGVTHAQTISATPPIIYNSSTGVISSQPASATQDGHITTGTQTIAGDKTFTADNIFLSTNFKIGIGGGSQLSNAALGYGALSGNSTGINNTAIGYNALVTNVSGSNNIGIGNSALSSTSGSTNDNIALGYAVGIQLTGSYNTFVGNGQVAYTTTSGQYNSAFGHGSAGQLTTGSFNTLLGRASGQGILTGSYNVIIGQNTSIGDVSNHIILADGQGNNRMVINNLGNLGIGTTSPNTKLDVNGVISMQHYGYISSIRSPLNNYTNLTLGGALKANSDGTYTVTGDGGSNYFSAIKMDNSGGNLGAINFYSGASTGGSDYNLSESDLANYLKMTIVNGKVGIGNSSPSALLTLQATSDVAQLRLLQYNTATAGYSLMEHSDGGLRFNRFGASADVLTAMALDPFGNVGIGTTSPQSRLEVQGSDTNPLTSGIQVKSPSYPQLLLDATNGGTNAKVWRVIGRSSNDFEIQALDDAYGIETTAMQINRSGASIGNILFPNGNVGIGTTDPKGYKLAVAGNAVAESMTVKLQANWPDYVFKKDYSLPSLSEVKTYIDKNAHLPEIPSAAEVEKDGQNLGEMNKLLLKKVEELTLYLIEKDKQLKLVEERLEKLENKQNK
ncbi:hypothetical protein BEL04_18895 [Mucilaginibacter sp. PPCGB 2223]|uniref:hypothetical protein n=1 Tax=Mucilaginibacter sp. PPCGB 2223 TaxID=1886027 RepID=UPI00082475A2|nr:hypothetical protein [Mucilaginibacter sp. PPCGB 2223]OCX50799.1 hypothetical protein BEL04_18895 [Mucilaginibacter sp. PPCGB 2223]